MSTYQDLFSNIIDSPDFAEIVVHGAQDPEKLEDASLARFYGYYTLLRITLTACAGVIAYTTYQSRSTLTPSVILFGGISLLFNPFVPIHLTRETWAPIDIAVSIVFVLVAILDALGRPDEARSAFEEVSRIAPQSSPNFMLRLYAPQPDIATRYSDALRRAGWNG